MFEMEIDDSNETKSLLVYHSHSMNKIIKISFVCSSERRKPNSRNDVCRAILTNVLICWTNKIDIQQQVSLIYLNQITFKIFSLYFHQHYRKFLHILWLVYVNMPTNSINKIKIKIIAPAFYSGIFNNYHAQKYTSYHTTLALVASQVTLTLCNKKKITED